MDSLKFLGKPAPVNGVSFLDDTLVRQRIDRVSHLEGAIKEAIKILNSMDVASWELADMLKRTIGERE